MVWTVLQLTQTPTADRMITKYNLTADTMHSSNNSFVGTLHKTSTSTEASVLNMAHDRNNSSNHKMEN